MIPIFIVLTAADRDDAILLLNCNTFALSADFPLSNPLDTLPVSVLWSSASATAEAVSMPSSGGGTSASVNFTIGVTPPFRLFFELWAWC